ncbi:MAG: hypothetical protein GX781_07595 [Clostridiales bacterium]|nr:hypothetical protein [Clostridiales bacterium]
MTAINQTIAILTPWLGGDFVSAQAPLMARISFKLAHFHPQRDSLPALAQDVDSQLFLAVRDDTKGRMILRLCNQQYMKVRLQDFATMTDELLYLVMSALPRNITNFRLVQEYSMRQGSLSALRALYIDFQAFQTEEEWRTVIRVIKTCHPPFRWRNWLEA